MKWKLEEINLERVITMEDYQRAKTQAKTTYFETPKQAFNHLGFRLKRERCGYVGTNGNTEYVLGKF